MTVTDVGRAPLRLYLSSRALALTGGSVAEAVIPLVVVITLGGGTTAVGAVTAITLTVSLATRIPISAWVDTRSHQIRLQAYSQLTAAATAAVIPVLWWTGGLSIVTLLIAVVLVVLAKTLVSACGHSTVNQLVPAADRVRAIGTLNSMSSAADIVGQTGGPALLKLLPAPLILLTDTIMNATSAILVRRLGRYEHTTPPYSSESAAEPESDRPPRDSLISIARQVISTGPVQLLWLSGIVGSVIAPVTLVYLIRRLGIDAALVGVLYAFGAIGGISGGLLAHRALTRLRMWPLITVSSLLSSVAAGCLLAAPHLPHLIYPLVIVFELLSAFAGTLLVAAVYGTLQTRTDHTQIARVMSIASTGMEGLALLGIGAGTLIAAQWSEHTAITAATIGYTAVSLIALMAALRSHT